MLKATKNRISVKIKGKLKRTSALVGKTENLMTEIQQDLQRTLGSSEKSKSMFLIRTTKRTEHYRKSTCRIGGLSMKELEQYKIPIIFGAIGLVLSTTICQHWLFQKHY